MQADEIVHNEKKKQLNYKTLLLKIYDFPVFYFPKFFHPDPSVKRQSGLLTPQINSSDELGDSIHVPYFHVISKNKDVTLNLQYLTITSKCCKTNIIQKNVNSSFIADFSLTTGYKSKLSEKKNSISHLFAKFNTDLKLDNFDYSNFYASIQKITNDTYLKVFDTNLPDTQLKPEDADRLTSEVKLTLNDQNSNLNVGAKMFEDLGLSNNDRYQYILPYYNYEKNIKNNLDFGKLSFYSSGNNDLKIQIYLKQIL